MSNEKLKSENYQLLGGINSKISLYQNSPLEFLDIKNFDFQTPNALTQRWGSTQYVTQTFGSPISALYEFSKLNGSSSVVIGHTGGLWFGATTGQSQGMSFTNIGATVVGATLSGPFDISYAGIGVGAASYGLTNVYYQGATSTGLHFGIIRVAFAAPAAPLGGNILDFVTLNDRLFMADGSKYVKFDGATTTFVGLPPPLLSVSSTLVPISGDGNGYWGWTLGNGVAGSAVGIPLDGSVTTGCYNYYAQYVNDRGFASQIWPICYFDYANVTPTTWGTSFLILNMSVFTPPGYGITAVNIYGYFSPVAQSSQTPSQLWAPNYVFLGSTPVAAGQTNTIVALGTTIGNSSNMLRNVGVQANPNFNQYFPIGITLAAFSDQVYGDIAKVSMMNVYPKYIESYQNRIFYSGVSTALSTIYFSDVIEPEGYRIDSNIEVRTNDSDVVTALKTYGTRMYIFKRGSFHCLIGDSPSNFSLQEVSLNYGCLNNRCVVVYEQIMLFLDRKGVMYYNGASLDTLSNKVQPIFDRMNYTAALDTAVMVHDKLRNQILIGIPVDGSTSNNLTVVYDYLTQAWTTYDGFTPTVFERIQGRNNSKNVFYGTPSGVVNWFGPSFLGDNSVGFTSYFKTRFLHDMGESIEKQFRRLYMNMDTGVTFSIPINFYQDYGASIVYNTTMVLNEFQKRIDFGIPAKSLAFEIFNLQTSSPLKIYGFTIESRFQRRT